MIIEIKTLNDVKKVIAFAKTNTNAVFKIVNHDFSWLFQELSKLAEEHSIKFTITDPSDDKKIIYSTIGGVIGGTIGYLIGGIPILIIGVAAGATSGYAMAHIQINIDPLSNSFTLA